LEDSVTAGSEGFVFVLQHRHERFDLMPYSIARTWCEEKGLDIALYAMYDAVELLKKDTIVQYPEIREAVDALMAAGVPVYACGFCSRACQLAADDYYPGVQVGNRHIFQKLMTERQPLYY
jgi:intracellular sulfur oxidation DsrE/DsrF family protein